MKTSSTPERTPWLIGDQDDGTRLYLGASTAGALLEMVTIVRDDALSWQYTRWRCARGTAACSRRVMTMPKKTYGKTQSGQPITNELVDELAKKAEAGYDVDEMLRREEDVPPWGPRRPRSSQCDSTLNSAGAPGAGQRGGPDQLRRHPGSAPRVLAPRQLTFRPSVLDIRGKPSGRRGAGPRSRRPAGVSRAGRRSGDRRWRIFPAPSPGTPAGRRDLGPAPRLPLVSRRMSKHAGPVRSAARRKYSRSASRMTSELVRPSLWACSRSASLSEGRVALTRPRPPRSPWGTSSSAAEHLVDVVTGFCLLRELVDELVGDRLPALVFP